jgi:hypothetical protein
MIGLAALAVSAAVAYIPHLIFGDRLDTMTDFLVGSVVGGIAYVVTYYQLRKLQGGL